MAKHVTNNNKAPQQGAGAFFRIGTRSALLVDPPVETLDAAGADTAIVSFFRSLAGDRPLAQHESAEDFVIDNALMVMLGADEEALFRAMLPTFPSATQQTWEALLSGGVSSETFGARTEDEVAEEERIDADLNGGRQRRYLLAGVGVLCTLLGVIGVISLLQRTTDEAKPSLTDFFGNDEGTDEAPGVLLVPSVATEFTTRLNTVLLVADGAAPAEDRIVVDPPEGVLANEAGSVAATLLQHDGEGFVAVAGPAGFFEDACIEVAVVSTKLRALDVGVHGACSGLSDARVAFSKCSGSTLVILQLRIPEGAVALPEGGSAVASDVRVGIIENVDGYETAELRGAIGVLPDVDGLAVPPFGGSAGDELPIDFGGVTGTCTIQARS